MPAARARARFRLVNSPAPSHTERWAYRWLYSAPVFDFTARLYPVLGRSAFHMVSRAVAAFYSHTQPGVVGAVRKNLELLGAPLSRNAHHEVFQNFARMIADYTALFTMSPKQALSLCGKFEGREHLEAAAPEGGLLATGHFGFFEFGAVVLQEASLPLTIATLAEPRPSLSRWRARWRQRWNAETIEIRADPFAALEVRRAIERARIAAVLADRPHPSQAMAVEYKGRSLPFSTTPAVLALATKRPIVPAVIFCRPDLRYHVRALPPLFPSSNPEDKRQEIRRLTESLGIALTTEFAKHPAQWYQFAPLPSVA